MNSTRSIKHKISAWMLTGIYVAFLFLLNVHPVFCPEHDHEVKVCHAAPGEQHIHSEEYTDAHCALCQIVPVAAELPEWLLPVFTAPRLPISPPAVTADSCVPVPCFALIQPRGPPAV